MLILKLNFCDYEKLAALKISGNKANAKLAKIKGFTVWQIRIGDKHLLLTCYIPYLQIKSDLEGKLLKQTVNQYIFLQIFNSFHQTHNL